VVLLHVAQTLEYHHDKHHLAYVNNGNNLLKGTGGANRSTTLSKVRSARTPDSSTTPITIAIICISGSG
jgi:superoxide dismutase